MTKGDKDEGAGKARYDTVSREFEARLDRLESRIEGARGKRTPEHPESSRGAALGHAFRLVTELVAGLVVGGFIGWQLDAWLDTTPFWLLVFFVLGAAAGILNVMRTARRMQKAQTDKGEGSANESPDRDDD